MKAFVHKYTVLVLEAEKDYTRLFDRQDDIEVEYLTYQIPSKKKIKKYNLIISFYYHRKVSRYIILKAKKLGVQTLIVQDGIYDLSNNVLNPYHKKNNVVLYEKPIADYFLCVGSKVKKMYSSEHKKTFSYIPKHMEVRGGCDYDEVSGGVLIATANSSYFNDSELFSLIGLIKQTINYCELHSIRYKLRVFDQEIIKQLSLKDGQVDCEGDFENCIKKYNALITTPSSIAYTAAYLQKPIITYQYRNLPFESITGWVAYDVQSLSNSIHEAVTLNRKEPLVYQSRCLAAYSSDFKSNLIIKNIIETSMFNNMDNKLAASDYIEPIWRRLYLLLSKYNVIKKIKKVIKS